MRQIKFRVYNTVNKHFISNTSNLWINPSFTAMLEWRPDLDGNTIFELNDSLVFQQYTGLKDKNGQEIYEGDLLWRPTVNRTIYLVDFNDENYGWVMGWNLLEYGIIDDKNNLSEFDKVQWSNNHDVVNYPVKSYYYGSSPSDHYEVVGNIFEGVDK